MRKPKRFYSLARPKIRQSWNKHNLYNLARMVGDQPPMRGMRTFFQQQWEAKARTRAYHGNHIPEKKWVRLFDRRLRSAVDMPPKYLAASDGSELAAGRGSGLSTNKATAEDYWAASGLSESMIQPPSHPRIKNPQRTVSINSHLSYALKDMTPYMQMTFAPLERRLDTAIFRAMFASSVRQARQFVIHGAVTVNGKKMMHPSYQLNPGDMFQVEVDKVLYATGVQKSASKHAGLQNRLEKAANREAAAQAQLLEERGESEEAAEAAEGDEAPALSAEEQLALRRQMLETLLVDVKMVLRDKTRMRLGAKEKSRLRIFRRSANKFLSRPEASEIDADELIEHLQVQMKELNMNAPPKAKAQERAEASEDGQGEEAAEAKEGEEGMESKESKATQQPSEQQRKRIDRALEIEGLDAKQKEQALSIIGYENLTKEEMRNLARLLKQEAENPVDETKPYQTPWQPRPFMSAFAFIPRYLEVNHNICAAIYLRHPVARKGLGEVPTPFPYFTNQLAHNWYLGRG